MPDTREKTMNYLQSKGWKLIGTKEIGWTAPIQCWTHPEYSNGRGYFTQQDAVARQRRMDKLAKAKKL